MQAEAAVSKVITDLTCWKCGEESLKEVAQVANAHNAKGEKVASSAIHHSLCEKCGAYSVNPVQRLHNKAVARTGRKAIIKEANRVSGT